MNKTTRFFLFLSCRHSRSCLSCYFFLLFLLCSFSLAAFDLKQEVQKAQAGDFIVYAYKQSALLVRIVEKGPNLLVVEEVGVPTQDTPDDWQKWLTMGAPGHTSWTISRIDVANGNLQSIFSVDEKQYLNANPDFQFLPTLFQLELKAVRPEERKMVGPAPLAGEQDFRRPWKPAITFEGKAISPDIVVYQVRWPKDDSELSGKPLDLYFAKDQGLAYLPYWIEVPHAVGKAKIAALDSGQRLTSPVRFESYEQSTDKGLSISGAPSEKTATH